MANPTTRVLALLELLQTHELMSGAELARRLEIDPRTLRRYINTLESLGIPVMTERGRDGGYRLIHGFKLPPMMFTNDEALALGLGLVAARSLGLAATTPASNSALSKLERVMPEKLRQRMRAVGETVSLDIAKATSSGDPEILALLSAATRDQQSVRLHYLSPQQVQTDRKIDPYGLAYLNGSWYVVAHCHLRKDTRSFRLDRIQSADLLPMSFGKPADFDAMRYISSAIATIPRMHQVKVLLHTDLASAHAAIFSAFGMLEPIDDNTILTIQADDLGWVARELARLPFSFAIQEPAALKEVLAHHARELLKIGRLG
ncbi:helix-turn-helix transcriptional regulator [Solimicrobium silvestre]|uniref:Putative transcriptional regulator n=1 Tax=Solimicrobium silvestre TaxID=2099400 RepID=A0A2S9H3T3_9BURK|nr:YafY family protein [Solimicrobium silvestre]PRC94627.1 putative transcriptional regulator [Solimicrobium silvestre]